MDLSSIGNIARTGMNLERSRVELASMKLAIANTGYASAGEAAQAAAGLVHSPFAKSLASQPLEATIKTLHDPNHPNANAAGDVFFVKIDPIHEMATLVSALRSYEANIRAYNTNSEMNQAALSIGSNK